MKKILQTLLITSLLTSTAPLLADDYVIDTTGNHASVNFKISHLGYSWLYGRFNEFSGTFSYDEAKPESASASVTINTASIDSNHAERDKHLRSGDFLDTDKFPEATFVSTAFKPGEGDTGVLEGNLTLHGVTKPISIDVVHIGSGDDPWGGFRRGFSGTAKLVPADFGMDYNLGPASAELELILSVEGIRQ
ncbi:MAG: YceI family protein [Gammaproteobacteria bacterium]|nr:YceI family protein [Gammaproteobacteria bacterium]